MLAYYAKRSPGEEFERISKPLPEVGIWIDGSNVSDIEIDGLIERYALDRNIVRDVRDRNELPRVEYSNGTSYVFVRLPKISKAGHVRTLPLLCVLGDKMFMTLSTGDSVAPESLALSTLPITTDHTETLLLGVMAAIVSTFEDMISHTNRSITDTANRLKTHDITNRDFIHFVTVEANLNHCRMNLDSTLVMAKRLHENKRETLGEDSLEALDDIALHIQQLLVSIDSHLGSVESIRNAYGTIANNTLNQRMKTLTVFTVLITLPNVFYGMYGMNVALPYGDSPWAYAMVVGASMTAILLVYAIAKKLRIF
ncbi:MAG: CorA family divalent cation transporter [Candidatus Saccharimonadales bacterium]